MADTHPIIAAMIARFEARRKTIEDQVKVAESVLHTVKDIKSMEDLENLTETTEKRITYMQARLEEIDHSLIEMLSGEETANIMSAAEALFKKQDAPESLKREAKPAPDFEIPKSPDPKPTYLELKPDGSTFIPGTVRNRVAMMKTGEKIKPWDFGKELMEKGYIEGEAQIRKVRSNMGESTLLRRIERGVYERI